MKKMDYPSDNAVMVSYTFGKIRERVTEAATIAASEVNPIPGLNVRLDIGIVTSLSRSSEPLIP